MNVRVLVTLFRVLFQLQKRALFALFFFCTVATSVTFSASLPSTLGYQGFITNASGAAQSGTAVVTVRIYDAAAGGALMFEEVEGVVQITNGYFSVSIGNVGDVNGSTPAVSITDLTFDKPYFITVALGAPFNTGEMTLSGGLRSPLNAVPYAITSYGVLTSTSSTGLTQAKGKLYYDTTLDQLFVNNGSSWQSIGLGGGGITSLNGIAALSQFFAIGSSGTDTSISSVGNTHTLSIPNAGTTSRGVVSTSSQSFAGDKTFTGTTVLATTTATSLTSASSTISVLSAGSATLTSASSTNFFANILSAVTTVISTLTGSSITGGTITATSSLVSNGSLTVTGNTSLATTTITKATITDVTSASGTITNYL